MNFIRFTLKVPSELIETFFNQLCLTFVINKVNHQIRFRKYFRNFAAV